MAENHQEDITVLEKNSEGFDKTLLDKDPKDLTPEEISAIRDNSRTQHALASHWRKKAKDSAPAPAPNNSTPAPSAGGGEGTDARVAKLEQAESKRQFGHQHSLSPEETDHVFAYAQGIGKKPDEVLEHPFIKNGLDAMRRASRASGATPGPSSRSPQVEGKSFKDMTPEERKKNFPKISSSLTGRG